MAVYRGVVKIAPSKVFDELTRTNGRNLGCIILFYVYINIYYAIGHR